MRDTFAEHHVVHIRVRVDMNQRKRTVPFRERAQDRQRDGVVAAERHRQHARRGNLREVRFDQVDRLLQAVGIQRNIAIVHHLKRIERRCAGGHRIGPHQHRLGTNLPRSIARAVAIAGADVERHAGDGNVYAGEIG